jgi:hypothetical protein
VGAGEVDETALDIGVEELHAQAIADVEPLLTLLDPTFDRRIEDARPGPLWSHAGQQTIELRAHATGQKAGRRRLAQLTLDLLRRIFLTVQRAASSVSRSSGYGAAPTRQP